MLIREEMAKDIAATHRATNDLSAKLVLDFEQILDNQIAFQASTNGTLATTATTISTITKSTSASVEVAVKGVTDLMVTEFGNIADTIAHVEGDMMAVLWGLVTLV
jgi:hypothetical protein